MYLDYFSLERHPFRITPDTSLFFSGGNQGRGVVLDAMLFAIESGEGILKVVGEVGSGKTMLCRMLEERLPETTEIVYLANPRLSPDEILYAIAFELKLPVRRDTSKLLVMQQLQSYLIKQHTANRRVLVIVEEAQGMPVETLEEIRLFSNLETQVDKLMQIILFGQPELDKNLSSKNIRQLRERITHSFHLNPLTTRELSEYVRFRLGAAGCPCPQLLTRRAEWLVSRASGGLTRRINILIDKALLAAFAEDVLDGNELNAGTSPIITAHHVWAAICDSEYLTAALRTLFSPLRVVSTGMLAALLVVAVLVWPQTGSIATQSQVADRLGGKFFEQQSASNPVLISTVGERDKETVMELEQDPQPQAQKPQLSPKPLDADVTLLKGGASAVSTTVQIAADNERVSRDRITIAPEEVARVEPSLLEGFSQPSLIRNIVATPTAQQLTLAEINFGSSAVKGKLQNRVLASIDWLKNSEGSGYTVQFLSGETSNLEFAESFLQVLDEHDLMADSYVCMSGYNNRSYWTIKYGNFDGLSLAQNFIDRLPATIYEYKPFVQNMSSVECNTNNSIAALILE
ncbi:MAG: type II secretory pathway predicted ATPase ExeA/septal ring-binding cell division protein DamX [Pseudohongiellaceae bacterium]|jgi:type II secretory pathway predicted ATPase ExeA/septal ring-binding cell division protein DamX